MNLYIWAAFASVAGCLVVHFWIGRFAELQNWRWYRLALITLPLSAIVNLLVKKPIGQILNSVTGVGEPPGGWPVWYVLLAVAIAPLTEEAIKLLPLVHGRLRRTLVSDPLAAYGTGTFLGLGFGIGEAWYLAWAIGSAKPEFAHGDFLPLVGFFGERTAVVLAHACLTSVVCLGIARRRPLRALGAAVGLHYLLNLGAGLHRAGSLSTELTTAATIISYLLLLRIAMKQQESMAPASVPSADEETLLRRRE